MQHRIICVHLASNVYLNWHQTNTRDAQDVRDTVGCLLWRLLHPFTAYCLWSWVCKQWHHLLVGRHSGTSLLYSYYRGIHGAQSQTVPRASEMVPLQ